MSDQSLSRCLSALPYSNKDRHRRRHWVYSIFFFFFLLRLLFVEKQEAVRDIETSCVGILPSQGSVVSQISIHICQDVPGSLQCKVCGLKAEGGGQRTHEASSALWCWKLVEGWSTDFPDTEKLLRFHDFEISWNLLSLHEISWSWAFMIQSSKRLLTLKLSESPRPAEPGLRPEALLAWLTVPVSIWRKPPHKESLSSKS